MKMGKENKLFLMVCGFLLMLLVGCGTPQSEQELLQSAQEHIKTKQLPEAAIELKKILRENPDNADARAMLGAIHLEQGDGVSAEKEFRRALHINHDDALLVSLGHALLAQNKPQEVLDELSVKETLPSKIQNDLKTLHAAAYLVQGEQAQVAQILTQVLNEDPENVTALLTQSRLLLVQRKSEDGESMLNKILAIDPENADALLMKGALAMSQNQFESAKQYYSKVVESYPGTSFTLNSFRGQVGMIEASLGAKETAQAAELADKLLKKTKAPQVLYLRGLAAFEMQEYEVAEDYLEQVLAVSSNHRQSIYLMGATKYMRGQYEQANRHLSQYVTLDPENRGSRKLLGATRIMLDRPEEAFELLTEIGGSGADDAQLQALIGSAAIRSGNYQLGRDYIEKILPMAPDNGSLRAELAMAYLAQGQTDDVIALLGKEAGGHSNDDLRNKLILISAFIQKKDFGSALRAAEEVIDRYPDAIDGYVAKARVYGIKGDLGSARDSLEQALALDTDSVALLLALAEIEYRAGQPEVAVGYFERAYHEDPDNERAILGLAQIKFQQGKESEAIGILEKSVKASQQAVMPRMLLARQYLRTGKSQQAEGLLEEVLAQSADADGAKLLISQLYLRENRPQKAVEILQGMTQENASPQALYLYAQAHWALGNAQTAGQALKKASQLDPDNVRITMSLVALAMRNKNYTEAENYVETIINKYPDSAIGYALKGDIHYAREQYQMALSSYGEAQRYGEDRSLNIKRHQTKVRLNHRDAQAPLLEWLDKKSDDMDVWMLLANFYVTNGNNADALDTYDRIIAKRPDDYVVLNNMAWLRYQQGDLAAGLDAAEKAYRLKQDEPNVLDTLGWLVVQSGDLTRGQALLEKAYGQNPEEPEIQYHYAYVLAKTNKHGEAKALLGKLLNGKGNFPSRSDAQNLYNQL